MSAKAQKTKARLPRGFVDREPGDLRATQTMLSAIQGVYERYGFAPIETPLVEFTDVLGKFLPDEDRPNAGVFSFLDDDEQWLSLRYDLTAPLARYVAENFQDMPKPYRSYRCGPVFRNEKAGPGRFRQFMQFDADTVGAPGPAADAEMCMMMADVMEAVGIGRGDYRIRVNNRKVLDGFMEAVGLEGEAAAPRRLKVLRAIDKLDRLGIEGVEALLGQGRRDESGDFTEGARLEPGGIKMLLNSFAEPSKDGGSAVLEAMRKSPAGSVGATAEGIGELEQMAALFAATGYDETRIGIDPSVVRGLEYYTGPVFEAELTFPVTNEKGEAVVFGSVGGGGRYDGLVARFTGQSVPATGTSIGVSRLLSALTNLGRMDMGAMPGPIIITVMDRSRLGDYMRLAAEIREGLNRDRAPGEPPVAVEMYQGNPKQFGKQLQYADRRDSPCVIIEGEDELANGVLEVKDLIEGKRLSAEIEDNVTWREARPAQITVPRGDIVAALRRLLDAQAADRASAAR